MESVSTNRRSFLRTLSAALAAPAVACAADPPPAATGEKPQSAKKTYVMTVRGPLLAKYLGLTVENPRRLLALQPLA